MVKKHESEASGSDQSLLLHEAKHDDTITRIKHQDAKDAEENFYKSFSLKVQFLIYNQNLSL